MKEYKYILPKQKPQNNQCHCRQTAEDHQGAGKNGYSYVGYIPIDMGASGKVLALDLIFKKEV